MEIRLTVNGRELSASVEPNTLLASLLRDGLALTGTHIGCDTSQCGACSVLLDGKSVKSCTMLAAEAAGATIVTIEGLATDGVLHPMQAAFHQEHGDQRDRPRHHQSGTVGSRGADLAQRQYLSMHRLPEHRQSHPCRRFRHAQRLKRR
jgi:aerobic-type carbon monoxide dehydrogenase small subunit (CoxS/CutS family)